MIIVDDCIISDDIAERCFCCDLSQCHGACCVEGDCGAPLDEEEIPILQRLYPQVKPFMMPAGIEVVERDGVSSIDIEGTPCTPLVNNCECAYAIQEGGITFCAIEKAYRAGVIDWPKPISCHLYPLRINDYGEFKALNIHEWDICRCARQEGSRQCIYLYRYLKEPLVRRFGQEWYDELVEQCEALTKGEAQR